ncbi:LINE-1 retrotransposable element ORF2 protein [Linum grandiflorum]
MSIIAWNCRGAGGRLTVNSMKKLVRKFNPSILFLMETKKKNDYMEGKRNILKFQHHFYVQPVERAGGLALWWIADLPIRIISSSKFFIDVFVSYGSGFYCTFVHAPSITSERRVFWEQISGLRTNVTDPWVVIGDCNAVCFAHEKKGRLPIRYDSTQHFRDFISSNALMDLGCKGDPLTWTNCQEEPNLVKARLDRALCSPSWFNLNERAMVYSEDRIGSDHAPIRLVFDGIRRTQGPFRYDRRWSKNNECKSIVKELWEGGGCCTEKLKSCKSQLITWSKNQHSQYKEKESDIRNRLSFLNSMYRDNMVVEEEHKLKKELDELWAEEEGFWRQRSGVQWLKAGDRNTRFFHSSTKFRRQRNTIARLQDDEGNWVVNDNNLKNIAFGYFKGLFSTSGATVLDTDLEDFPLTVTNEMNDHLCQPVDNEEIRRAVFSLATDKSPGPDGFSGDFYKEFWADISESFCSDVKSFFTTAKMPEGWNSTHIALIPKVQNPTSMAHFRPISCCNFNYKVISKIMTQRLKKWIPILVSETQAAFTGGRVIQDNIIIVHEVLHQFKIRRSGRRKDMMLKLDMRKAYDLVEWDSLEGLLTAYGFAGVWVSWIRECIRTVDFSILFNGQPTSTFTPERGIRQGDPLSPFLFILMSNALSFLIDKGIRQKRLTGIKLRRNGPTLSHCLFADDTIIFGKASLEEAQRIIDIIGKYGASTGQEVNLEKSSVFFSKNVMEADRTTIVETIGFSPTNCHSKYLGVPTEWGRSKKETFSFLIDRLIKRGHFWQGLLLSHAGKETLIKAVLQAIPTYVMSSFLLPKAITRKMDSLIRNFFWSGSMEKRSIHWCNAAKLCSAKFEGGLGFRNFHDFNFALLAKQGWRLITSPDALWARVLKSIYFPKGDFLSASKSSRPSWIWAGLCQTQGLLKSGVIRIIGDGSDSWISKHPWVPTLPGFRLWNIANDQRRVADWILHDPPRWNVDAIAEECDEYHTSEICRVPVGPQGLSDDWAWKTTK